MKNQDFLHEHYEAIIHAPFGAIGVVVQGLHISIDLMSDKRAHKKSEHKLAVQIVSQIEAYLKNSHYSFNLPLRHKGTPFQRSVWLIIESIPCGQVLTYSDIASQLGSSPRAVANACGANHLPIIIPCHRVVAKNGLGGFMKGAENGLSIKTWLLKHEHALTKSGKHV